MRPKQAPILATLLHPPVRTAVAQLYVVGVLAVLLFTHLGVIYAGLLLVLGTGWAVGPLRVGLAARIGFGAAVAGGLAGSAACLPVLLIGTQAMGTGQPGESLAFALLFAIVAGALAIVFGLGGAISLVPLRRQGRYKAGVVGFAAGAALGAALGLLLMVLRLPLPQPWWTLLATCGQAAVIGMPAIGGTVMVGRRPSGPR